MSSIGKARIWVAGVLFTDGEDKNQLQNLIGGVSGEWPAPLFAHLHESDSSVVVGRNPVGLRA